MARQERPFIHINLAMDERGRVATPQGAPLALSCRDDWRRVHVLRERCDAVAVGARTWILDSPSLNVRVERLGREPRRQPARVIFAGSHDCAVTPDARRTFIIGSGRPSENGHIFIRSRDHQLREPLQRLHRHGVRSMLVEGGPTLLRSFLSADFVDSLTVYVRTQCLASALKAARETILWDEWQVETGPLGEGILLRCRPRKGRAPAAAVARASAHETDAVIPAWAE